MPGLMPSLWLWLCRAEGGRSVSPLAAAAGTWLEGLYTAAAAAAGKGRGWELSRSAWREREWVP